MKKYRYYVPVFLLASIYIFFQSKIHTGDFKTFFAAADYFKQGKNFYDTDLVLNGEIVGKYSYGSTFALLLIPLTYLPLHIAFFLFFQIQMLLLFRTFFLISNWLPLEKLNEKGKMLWWIFTTFCCLRFVLHNVEFGQVTILILYLCMEGLNLIFFQYKLAGALLLGLCIHIKIMPVILIPYLLWRSQWRAVLIIAGTIFVLCFIPLLAFDFSSTLVLFNGWMKSINPFIARDNQFNFTMQGLQPLFAAALLDITNDQLGFKTNLTAISDFCFSGLLNFSRLFFVLLTFYFLEGFSLKKAKNKLHLFWELSYLFMTIPLIFPQQQKYSLLFLTPFFSYMIWYLLDAKQERSLIPMKDKIIFLWFALLLLPFIFTSDLFVGSRLNYIFQSLKVLTLALLFSVPLLGFVKPPKDTAVFSANSGNE